MSKSQWTVSMMVMAFLVANMCATMGWAEGETIERKGPLKDLPSESKGEHLKKIAALGDHEWVDLGSPAPDPKTRVLRLVG